MPVIELINPLLTNWTICYHISFLKLEGIMKKFLLVAIICRRLENNLGYILKFDAKNNPGSIVLIVPIVDAAIKWIIR